MYKRREAKQTTPQKRPFFDAPADETGQIPAFAVLHDDVQRGVGAVDDAVVVPHDVGVLQLPEEIDL